MAVFTVSELADFKTTHIDSFQSVCTINRNAVSTDSYGDIVLTPTSSTGVECGFSLQKGSFTEKESNISIEFDGIIRLPVNTATIGLNDTITITSHLGNTKNDTFKIVSVPEIGNVMTIYLKRYSN